MSDVIMGVSVLHNRRLANIFYRLHLIEAFGTGMLKIKGAMPAAPASPLWRLPRTRSKLRYPI